jgi:aminoglycoside phosphotransferase (APT) family kinase protein
LPLLCDNTRRQVTWEIHSFINSPEHFAFHPVLIHGDFAVEHVLVDTETGRVTGIIDFGDCGLGDPAYDVWPELNPYYTRPVDGPFFVRQRFYRRLAPFHGALFGLQTGDDKLVESSLCEIETIFGA